MTEEDKGTQTVKVAEPKTRRDVVSIDEITDNVDFNAGTLERQGRNPFAGYPIRLIEARYYPRDPLLDQLSRDELIQYCIRNEFFSRQWIVKKGIDPTSEDKHKKVMNIKTDWKKEEILRFIDSKQTHTFPSHHLVFIKVPSPKQGVPYMYPAKSWYSKRFERIWFDLQWPMPTPEDPMREGMPNQCAIVSDDSIRAQMFFRRQVKTGKVIRRKVGEGNGSINMFALWERDQARSLEILRDIFLRGTKGSADLQAWKREGDLPSL